MLRHSCTGSLLQRAAFGTVDDTVSQTSTGDVHATSVATLSAAEVMIFIRLAATLHRSFFS